MSSSQSQHPRDSLRGKLNEVMLKLEEAGYPLSISQVAEATKTDQSNTSKRIKVLVRKGLVELVESPTDARVKLVKLKEGLEPPKDDLALAALKKFVFFFGELGDYIPEAKGQVFLQNLTDREEELVNQIIREEL